MSANDESQGFANPVVEMTKPTRQPDECVQGDRKAEYGKTKEEGDPQCDRMPTRLQWSKVLGMSRREWADRGSIEKSLPDEVVQRSSGIVPRDRPWFISRARSRAHQSPDEIHVFTDTQIRIKSRELFGDCGAYHPNC